MPCVTVSCIITVQFTSHLTVGQSVSCLDIEPLLAVVIQLQDDVLGRRP